MGSGAATGAQPTSKITASRPVLSHVEGLALSNIEGLALSLERGERAVEGLILKIERDFMSLLSFSLFLDITHS